MRSANCLEKAKVEGWQREPMRSIKSTSIEEIFSTMLGLEHATLFVPRVLWRRVKGKRLRTMGGSIMLSEVHERSLARL